MNKRSISRKSNKSSLYNQEKMFEVEERMNKTPKELLMGIRIKIQGVLKK